MEEHASKIKAVSNALKNLFAESGTLRGIGDWDILIQCVVALDEVAEEMTRGEENG